MTLVERRVVMDAIAELHGRRVRGKKLARLFKSELALIRSDCHWTTGEWVFTDGRRRKWNEIQNTPKDVQLLAIHLLSQYETRVRTGQ